MSTLTLGTRVVILQSQYRGARGSVATAGWTPGNGNSIAVDVDGVGTRYFAPSEIEPYTPRHLAV